ncbi:hypothetical protein BH23GEM9_BH23GEM9_13940 [soil metagenome]
MDATEPVGLLEISAPRHGGYLAVRYGRQGESYIGTAPVDSPNTPRPFLATPGLNGHVRVSPDGALLACVTEETGRREVYVRPLPGPGPRVQVSTYDVFPDGDTFAFVRNLGRTDVQLMGVANWSPRHDRSRRPGSDR